MKYTNYMCYAAAVLLAGHRGLDSHEDYEKELDSIYNELVAREEAKKNKETLILE